MWLRNLLFLAVLGAGAYALGANLLPPRQTNPLTGYDNRTYRDTDFLASVNRVNDAFRKQRVAESLKPAPAASELAVARRLALALAGTIPSLEEVRQFEALPEGQRLPWYLDHLLNDRRYADYFAERCARA